MTWRVLQGSIDLLASKNGALCLAILACTTVVAVHGHIDGNAFAAAMACISSVFMWTSHKTDIAAMNQPSIKTIADDVKRVL